MPLRVVLFDLDGTLVDTIKDIASALNVALTSVGLPARSVDEVKSFVGEGASKLVEKVLGEEKKFLREEVKRRFLEAYSEHPVVESVVYPGVRETLGRLGAFDKAIISNKWEYLSREILGTFDLLGYFNLIVGSESTADRKPSAVPVIYALSRLRAAPREAVMVGDSIYDVQAGSAAGVATVAVTYGYQDRHLLSGADCLIEEFTQLPTVLDSLSDKLI